ncbi:MAG: hypothetical protein QNK29_12635, partial [Desulfobacterales bacterium]|nr:hypothetical protein [Desulfobacterales bacterium]MDX2512789.1 hypothetical protein [Desulfobacterales bacterium]
MIKAGNYTRQETKRSDMEDHKIKLYETQLRRLFKAAEQDEQETPKPVPVHREKIRVIRRRKGGPDQYITESSNQYALASADMG